MNKVIQHIKNRTLIKTIRKKYYVKRKLSKSNDNPEKYLVGLGKILLGYKMNLKTPTTFNEKLNWYKLNYHNDLMSYVVDKISAKDYVENKGLSDILIKTIQIYNSIDEVNLNDLPSKFVIKNTQDSGGVFVCKDKDKATLAQIKDKLKTLNKEIYNGKHWALEQNYTSNTNKIIVEELLETSDGTAPWDYKFFCFNGEPKFLFVGSDRDTSVCFDFFDINFNHLDVIQGHPLSKKQIKKPEKFDEMLDVCRVLSKDFPHVRVDLYYEEGKIYFGELTFYHFAGLVPFKPKTWDYKFGEYFDLSSIRGDKQ